MKRLLICIAMAIALVGCAASTYRNARESANLVTNGMTIAQATAVLGMEPSHRTADKVQWRRGNAQFYDGTRGGAIEFNLKDGLIDGVPPGGIFGPSARLEQENKRLAFNAAAESERLKELAEKDARDARLAKEREEAAAREAENAKVEIEAELAAIPKATYQCADKPTCAKVFALAQIYASKNADQKIQVATDTIIETYNPTEPGKLGVSITKTPKRGTTEVISVTAVCKSDSASSSSLCRHRRTSFYLGFRPFIEASLQK